MFCFLLNQLVCSMYELFLYDDVIFQSRNAFCFSCDGCVIYTYIIREVSVFRYVHSVDILKKRTDGQSLKNCVFYRQKGEVRVIYFNLKFYFVNEGKGVYQFDYYSIKLQFFIFTVFFYPNALQKPFFVCSNPVLLCNLAVIVGCVLIQTVYLV